MKNKFKKLLSLILVVTIVLSLPVLGQTSVLAQTATFYVKKYGSDLAAGTKEAPFATVSKAISNAVNAGFTTGDTVTLRVMEFPDVSWGEVVSYDFNLQIISDTSSRCNVAIPTDTALGGNVSFSNAVVKCKTLFFNNNDVEFDENCILEGTNYYFGSQKSENTTVSGQKITFKTAITDKKFYITDQSAGDKKYSDDFNLTINNSKANPDVCFTNTGVNVVFEGDLNINMIKAPVSTFTKGAGTVAVNGALQLFTTPDATINSDSLQVLKSLNAAGGFYHIVNNTGVENILGITGTPGRYAVNTNRYTVWATAEDGSVTQSADGYLVLAKPGKYEITTLKIIENPVYYVSSEGNSANSGLTTADPLPTVGDAVLAAKEAGYWGGDTVAVRILSQAVNWGMTYETDSKNDPKPAVRKIKKYGYEFLLSVCSNDAAVKSTVIIPKGTPMLGDVKFDNVNIPKIETFPLYDESITITESVSFNPDYVALGYSNKQNYVYEKVDVNLFNKFNGYLELTNSTYAGIKFNEDVTVTINNSESTPGILFLVYWGGTTTFNGNLNINVANAKSVSFGPVYRAKVEGTDRNEGKTVINKAAHIIVNSKTSMDSNSISSLNELAAIGKMYYISNNTGIADLLEFTETEGKFKIKSGYENYVITAVDNNGKPTVSSGGYLTLANTGYYSISAQITSGGNCQVHTYTDNCDAMCNVCGALRNISHQYNFECDNSCKNCGIKRLKYHSIAVRIIPATAKKDGENQDICDICYKVLATKKIERVSSFKLEPASFAYDGTNKQPKVIMRDTTGEKLVEDLDYNLVYPKKSIDVGTYKVKVVFKREFKGTKKLTYTITPPKSKVSKVTAGSNKLKVTLKKKKSFVDGYEIEYSTSKKFLPEKTKQKTVKGYKNTLVVLEDLNGKTNYYVRVRTYKTVGKTKIYSAWSKAVKKKTKGVFVASSNINKVTAAKKSLKLKLKKAKKVSGYQIEYSTNKSFKPKYTKTKNIKKNNVTLKKLKAKKNYYVRVRGFKKAKGKTYYSDWSSIIKSKTK